MPGYNCSLMGQCLPSHSHSHLPSQYLSLAQCQANCHSLEDRQALDLSYIILSYDWSLALQLSQIDQIELIRRTFKHRVSADQAYQIIKALVYEEVDTLLNFNIPELTDYIMPQLDDLDLFILELNKVVNPTKPHVEQREFILERMKGDVELNLSDADLVFMVTYDLFWSMEIDPESQSGVEVERIVGEWLGRLRGMEME